MKRLVAVIAAGAIALVPAPGLAAGNGNDPDLRFGDIAQIAIPAFGLGMTWVRDDAPGRKQWLESTASNFMATQALKYAFADTAWGTRPNGGPHSFPSGHTSSACSGASFLAHRYGWNYGGPALALAAVTGYSRVDERMHHARDVIAGCALAYGLSRAWVTPRDEPVTVFPVVGNDEVGLAFEYRY